MKPIQSILIVGATGSIGRFACEFALREGFEVFALVRNEQRADLPAGVRLIEGDLTKPLRLPAVDAVVFAQGSYDSRLAEQVDYRGVLNVLRGLAVKPQRIALMTSIYAATARAQNSFWKRRAERLVRASGVTYTIVRPAWFDCERPGEQALEMRQQGGQDFHYSAQDGGVSREQIGETLVKSLTTTNARNRTISLYARPGSRTQDFEQSFAATLADTVNSNFDGIKDPNNQPWQQEPTAVQAEILAAAQA